MKEKTEKTENTPKRKKLIYSLILAVCVLLLVTATILTVYFVTTGKQNVLENPVGGTDEPGGTLPEGPDEPGGTLPENPDEPGGNLPEDPSQPSGGDDTVKFVSPVAAGVCTVNYDAVYTNMALNGSIRIHKAVDFAAQSGTDVVAVSAGTVQTVSYSNELGNLIVIDHGDGLKSYYRFIEPIEGLKEGAKVECGEKIAEVAEAYGTENKDGEHLHFQLELNAEWVDPADYFDVTYEEK